MGRAKPKSDRTTRGADDAVSPRVAEQTRVLDALGNDVRRDIVLMLVPGPRAVGEIAAAFPISRPAVSKHLRILEHAALVRVESEGTRNFIHIDRRGFDAARAWLDAFWDEALPRFAMVAENLARQSSSTASIAKTGRSKTGKSKTGTRALRSKR